MKVEICKAIEMLKIVYNYSVPLVFLKLRIHEVVINTKSKTFKIHCIKETVMVLYITIIMIFVNFMNHSVTVNSSMVC